VSERIGDFTTMKPATSQPTKARKALRQER